jgi:beta-glucosidase
MAVEHAPGQGGPFPAGFIWGTATASYQIEGAVREDGRGESIWDRFSHTPGKTLNGDTGDGAADHYHRWREDLALMREIGISAYRFSIAWPRVVPEGRGAMNQAGLDWYSALVDGLLDAGIAPFVTLYHWDLPQALQDEDGWASRATVDAFLAYVEAVARRLGDRVKHWITFNEPWVVAMVGNFQGRHAPGLRDLRTALQVAHNELVAHGRAVPLLRSLSPQSRVGITLNLTRSRPASDSPEDALAARYHDGHQNRWFLDPIFGRGYPADMMALYGDRVPVAEPGDLDAAAAPLDFLGINYYSPTYVRALSPGEDAELGFLALVPDELHALGYGTTEIGKPMTGAKPFADLLVDVHRTYRPPAIFITENGAATPEEVADGAVHDPLRVAYLEDHVRAVRDAIEAGAPVRGYFVWSLMDNFEWAWGYSMRFGLVHVDYATQRRTVKDSGHWYKRLIQRNSP